MLTLNCHYNKVFLTYLRPRQVSAQDIQEKFWEIIDEINVNKVIKWFTNNIVFSIILFTRCVSRWVGGKLLWKCVGYRFFVTLRLSIITHLVPMIKNFAVNMCHEISHCPSKDVHFDFFCWVDWKGFNFRHDVVKQPNSNCETRTNKYSKYCVWYCLIV